MISAVMSPSIAKMPSENADFEDAVDAIEKWLIRKTLGNVSLTKIFTEFSRRIDQTLFPLIRSHVTMRQMHPFIDHTDHTWNREGEELTSNSRPRSPIDDPNWVQSPLYYMLENVILEYRCDMTQAGNVKKFPIFSDFEQIGGTDYIAFLTPFGSREAAIKSHDGVMSSWLTDKEGGFEERDIAALKHLLSLFDIAARVFKREQTLQDVLSAYLGPLAANQVMEGKTQRGDGDIIQAVIWICDLRGSSSLADQMAMADYLALLNQFFESMSEAVMAEGGEVLKFMGDGFLAIFPTPNEATIADAANRALTAAQKGANALAALPSEAANLKFGIGIHHGDVMFGNIGARERLDFSVIGPAVNMASRIQDLTKTLDANLLVTSAIAEHLDRPWRSFDPQSVPGLKDPIKVLTPA
ncbi:adenylate/guanylate cyclase domain-containing protein [uncultured Sneathiella sp.]|uniref:adenylate/guanylate cyclase domain-containing protein n=1 Tax=uncultured Sneathiella sp. TaxID=879315 RepID=UPI0030EC051B|tara:strand:- start:7048 stop:8283 length:1236 start_codon:yes stop_codon:yes gene_type:complete